MKVRTDLFRQSFLNPHSQLSPAISDCESSLQVRRKIFFKSINTHGSQEPRNSVLLQRIATLLGNNDMKKETEVNVQQSPNRTPIKKYQKLIYLLLKNPQSSLLSLIIHLLVILGIFFNLFEAIFISPKAMLTPSKPLIFANTLVLIIFSLEFVIRVFSATAFGDRLTKALLKPLIIVDILSIVPLFVISFVSEEDMQSIVNDPTILAVFKTVSVLKLSRYVKNAHVLAKGIRQSLTSFAFLMFVIVLANIVFATMAYYAERVDPRSKFNKGIPIALWWSMVTMTTVGYGDVTPITPLGKTIGSVVGIFGMMVLALPVVILGYHFEEVYNEIEDEEKMSKIKDRILNETTDLSQRQKEAYFIRKRIHEIETINKVITQRLEASGKIYDDVSHDLKSLYSSVTATAGESLDAQEDIFGSKAKAIERFASAKRKISVVQIFQRGFKDKAKRYSLNQMSAQEPFSNFLKPEDTQMNHLSMDSMDILKKLEKHGYGFDEESSKIKSANQFDEPENIIFNDRETISRMDDLRIKPSVLFRDKSSNLRVSNNGKSDHKLGQLPKIFIDTPSREHIPIDQKDANAQKTPILFDSCKPLKKEGDILKKPSYLDTLMIKERNEEEWDLNSESILSSQTSIKNQIKNIEEIRKTKFAFSARVLKPFSSLFSDIEKEEDSPFDLPGLRFKSKNHLLEIDNPARTIKYNNTQGLTYSESTTERKNSRPDLTIINIPMPK